MIKTDNLVVTLMHRTGTKWCTRFVFHKCKDQYDDSYRLRGHTPWCMLRVLFPGPGFKSYVQIRNPHDWIASLYAYTYMNHPDLTLCPYPIPPVPIIPLPSVDFITFVTCLGDSNYVDHCYQLYTEGVDFVGTTENAERDLTNALTQTGCAPSGSTDKDWSFPSKKLPQWGDDLKDWIKRKQPRSFAMWEDAS